MDLTITKTPFDVKTKIQNSVMQRAALFADIRVRDCCASPGCDASTGLGFLYCKAHRQVPPKQSEKVNPKLEARNSLVMAGECYVYAIECADQVKIGKAMDVSERFASLQTGSPFDLVLLGSVRGPKSLEREIHKWAAADRKRGEWFAKSERVMRLVDRIKAGKLAPVLDLLRQGY
jgi:hypothetical protein